ncbi:MAG: Fur family transcriptional regulator [Chloroflexota bacterium]|nr:Fur family transcriptional regulator [Chloroflexota bacterium]
MSEALREKGYRLTPQRMIVLDAVETSDDHISAEEIHRQALARYPYINISTIYRTLELLKELGLVAETNLGGGRLVYHPAGKAHHHHLVCRNCGKIQDIDGSAFERLRKDLSDRYRFQAEFEHVAVFGVCDECAG